MIRRLTHAGLALALGWFSAGRALAQEGFRINRFVLAPSAQDGFVLQLPDTLGHLRYGVRLGFDYAREALVTSAGIDSAIVRDALGGQLALALGITERIEVYAALPTVLIQAGDERAVISDASGLGDARVGASTLLLGDGARGLQLGARATLSLPTGSQDALAGDGGFGAGGAAQLAWYTAQVRSGIEFGAAYRPKRSLGGFSTGTELSFGAGTQWQVRPRVDLLAEIDGAYLFDGPDGADSLPLEVRGGARCALTSALKLSGGVGAGLTGSPGVPRVRAFVVLDWSPSSADSPAQSARPAARERELSEPHGTEAKPSSQAPTAPAESPFSREDRDRDAFLDAADMCPDEAEDMDGFEDDDGCPEPDNDADGLADEHDKCPVEPESFNQVDDEDGCPDWIGAIVVGRLPGVAPAWFDSADAEIHQDSLPTLEKVREMLTSHPEITRLTVIGHSSSDGSDSLNDRLARLRAIHVRAWLVDHGIAARRLHFEGHGSREPLEDNETPRGRRRNRRVEFHVTRLAPKPGI